MRDAMLLIMPKHPLEDHGVDPDFLLEYNAALKAGFSVVLYDHDSLVRGKIIVSQTTHTGPAILRGWMMKPSSYGAMFSHLLERGIRLLTSPEAYRYCHHLPEWYSALSSITPKSVWVSGSPPSVDACISALGALDSESAIVKDYVKSWKHDWHEACYIPKTADSEVARKVIGNFINYQGSDLNEGVVLRAFEQFQQLGSHPDSGMPLSVEFRVFVFRGELLISIPYWPEIGTSVAFDPKMLHPIVALNPSPFNTADFALTENGRWRLVELGDGQVAGLQGCAPETFYSSLSSALL